MKFGKTLRESIYAPWKDDYIDYNKLKSLLRERTDDDDVQWTEDDENRFCEEMFNVQLEKVTRFQESTFASIRDRVNSAFDKIRDLAPKEKQETSAAQKDKMREVEKELDELTRDVRELKSFTRINYTGFQKIAKKHDRKRGGRYRVRPMMQVTMSNRPFTTETSYSPLLKKLSIMYFIIRQHLDEDGSGKVPVEPVDLENNEEIQNGERYTAYKCERTQLGHANSSARLTLASQSGYTPTTCSRSRRTSYLAYQHWFTLRNPRGSSTRRPKTPPSPPSTSTTPSLISTWQR